MLGQNRPRRAKRPWNLFGQSIDTDVRGGQTPNRTKQYIATSTVPMAVDDHRPSLRMLADVALADDLADKLGFKPFADAIAGIVDSPNTSTPLVMAVNARWGAGKTSLGQMIKRRLENKSAADGHAPHVTCWFAAWMHDDAPNLATALAAEVAQVASRSRPLWRRIAKPLPSSLSTAGQRRLRRGFMYSTALTSILLLGMVVSLRNGYGASAAAKFDPELVRILTAFKGNTYLVGLVVATIFLFKAMAAILPVAKSVGEYVKDPQSTAKTASMQEVRSQLGKLIKQATPKRSKFVIFIDDLDRCRPPHSVDLLEAVNQLLDHSGVVVVLMSDMQVVAKCAEIKYKELANETGTPNSPAFQKTSYGQNFLQKIIQLQFDLPNYSPKKIRQMIQELVQEVPDDRSGGRSNKFRLSLRVRSQRIFTKFGTSPNLGSWGLLLIAVLGIGLTFWTRHGIPPQPSTAMRLFLIVGTASIVLLMTGATLKIIARLRESRRRSQIDVQIKARISAGERDFSRVEAYVKRENNAWRDDPEVEGLVRERLQRYLEDESELQREAEDEVMRHLEPVPRHAKRLLNRLRLLLFIAHERKMFGGKPNLSARHIGKWAVLGERWPDLLQQICLAPSVMKALESLTSHDDIISECVPLYKNDKALRHFCLSTGGVKLWPVVRRIVRFAPSSRLRTAKPFEGYL
jgi:hypothetical protein